MASPVEDVSKLPGETVFDQWGQKIGEVKQIYAVDEGEPMWVTVEASTGVAGSKTVFVPIARLKREDDQIRVPYTVQHIEDSPELEPGEELSQEDDRQLRDYYAIDHADQELRSDGKSYADLVPEKGGQPRVTDESDVKSLEVEGDAEGEASADTEEADASEGAEEAGASEGEGEEQRQGDEGQREGDEGETGEGEERSEDQ